MTHTSPSPRKPFRLFSEAEWQDAMASYAAGESASAISQRIGMSMSAIYKRAGECGLQRRQTGAAPAVRGPILKRIHRPRESYEAAVKQWLAGDTDSVVCELHGLNKGTFALWRSRNNISKTRFARAVEPQETPSDITPEEADARWRTVAHAAQVPPEGAWRTWLFQGGRGAGKTRAGAEWIAARAAEGAHVRIALIGATLRDVREVMVDGPSGLAHLPHRAPPRFEAGRQRLVFASGAVAYAFSAQEPERLRGPQFDHAWADEFCAWKDPAHTLRILRMGLRRGSAPRLVVTTTPKTIAALRQLRAEGSTVTTQAPTAANAAHLAPAFLDGLEDLYGGTRFAAQELGGVMVENDGALWRAKDFIAARGAAPPAFDEVVVAVDPPAGEEGAACGIVVAGRVGRQGFVLADRTARGLSPLGWAQRVAAAAAEFGARRIIAEANQGGAMVRTTLASAEAPCAVHLVHARDGKRVRAEPVAALYEQGRITHCAAFVALEEELMALSAGDGGGLSNGGLSNGGLRDRADALVWALTALLVERPPTHGAPRIVQL